MIDLILQATELVLNLEQGHARDPGRRGRCEALVHSLLLGTEVLDLRCQEVLLNLGPREWVRIRWGEGQAPNPMDALDRMDKNLRAVQCSGSGCSKTILNFARSFSIRDIE